MASFDRTVTAEPMTPITEINHPVRQSSTQGLALLSNTASSQLYAQDRGRHKWTARDDELLMSCVDREDVKHPKSKRIQWDVVKSILAEQGVKYNTPQQVRCRMQRLRKPLNPVSTIRKSSSHHLRPHVSNQARSKAACSSSDLADTQSDAEEVFVSSPRPEGISDTDFEYLQSQQWNVKRITNIESLIDSILGAP